MATAYVCLPGSRYELVRLCIKRIMRSSLAVYELVRILRILRYLHVKVASGPFRILRYLKYLLQRTIMPTAVCRWRSNSAMRSVQKISIFYKALVARARVTSSPGASSVTDVGSAISCPVRGSLTRTFTSRSGPPANKRSRHPNSGPKSPRCTHRGSSKCPAAARSARATPPAHPPGIAKKNGNTKWLDSPSAQAGAIAVALPPP